jgi:small subunit ribosomal protein S16
VSVRIRLTRTGRKNLPSYRISVFDQRTRRDGPALEILGWYNPLSREAGKGFNIEQERLLDWVARGAVPTLPLKALLKRQGVKWMPEGKAEAANQRRAKERVSNRARKSRRNGAAAKRRSAAGKKV